MTRTDGYLTDRYVAATVAHIPANQRADIEAELRASIADAIDAQPAPASGTAESSEAERAVLEALGDPELLAATYAERPLYVIGPRTYLPWKRLTVLLLWIVVPIVAMLAGIASLLDGDGWGSAVGATVSAAWGTAILLIFWVTVVFAAIERYGTDGEPITEPWTVDRLDEASRTTVTWGETIGGVVALVLVGALIVWQQVWPFASTADGEGLPTINPDLWSFVLPALLVVMALEGATVIHRHVRGHWKPSDAWVVLGLNLAVLALLLPPLLNEAFLNRALFDEIGWPDANSPVTLAQTELIVAGIVVLSAIGDVWNGFAKARAARRTLSARR